MKRRLDLAAALVHNPDVLFLDEPTTGLDPVSRATVWEEVRRLNTELGMTIFLTTQYLEEADELADRVGIIDAGRIVAEGTPDNLKRTIGTDVIFVRLDGDADRARVGGAGRVRRCQTVEARGHELVVTVDGGLGHDRPGGGGARRAAACRCATSRCARRRSTTCSSSSPARHIGRDDDSDDSDARRPPTRGEQKAA